MELDGLLHLLYGALEVAGGLWPILIGSRLGGMDQHATRVVILIGGLHGLKIIFVEWIANEVDVIALDESMPLTGGRSVLLRAACSDEQAERRNYKAKCHFSMIAHNFKT